MLALARTRAVAPAGWSRWLVPPAALSIHLAIGQVYAWSVFKPPLESSLGLSGTASALPFQLAIVMLGLSAAFGGTLVERHGPRRAMSVSALCFSSGFLVAALGAATSQYWLVVLGYGFIGGIGLGIGYISPVSTLLKWFPDRPGMATGIAIMGFGGGALIASPWSTGLLKSFGTDPAGIARTFVVMGLAYALFMTPGALLVRVPPGVRPAGGGPATGGGPPPGERPASAPVLRPGPGPAQATAQVTARSTTQVSARNALRTPQFWCLWVVLCMNVTAGIGILEKAAPMVTDFFAGTSAPVSIPAAAGFVGLLSLANMLGRILWSSASDGLGRKNVYRLFLGVGAGAYLLIALAGGSSKPLFIACAAVILSFYGGGFATVPAYLKDLFGTYQVGAIHGRLLTAWSTAGILGPLIVNAVADGGKAAGRSGPGLYTPSFFIMIGLLAVAFVANELVRPVSARHHEPGAGASGPAPATPEGAAT
ncbi:OFA family MFS transporter [Streptomyces sp. MST-110588]|uniref:OFA family MFS transporter n=1 Tax=Streptomyces sp. MST-110588 TaxID=2833628 RepID=UPI001F5CAA10|nr:OFA family MFS transporter [Streptomyces sp. MST-110588]UNO42934.1 OFA family MFS transporter [Streptomyces sp. MST-110588]